MKNKLLGIMTVAAAIGLTQIASAIPYPSATGLLIYDSTGAGTTALVALSGSGTSSYNAAVGDWTVVLTSGATINGGASPQIDLDVTSASAGAGAGTLYIFFTSGLFGPSVGTWSLTTTEASGSLSSYAYASSSLPLVAGNLLGGGADPNTYGGALNSGGLQYYMAIEDVINGSVVSSDSNLSVPDGGTTVILLGAALSGLGLVRKMRRA